MWKYIWHLHKLTFINIAYFLHFPLWRHSDLDVSLTFQFRARSYLIYDKIKFTYLLTIDKRTVQHNIVHQTTFNKWSYCGTSNQQIFRAFHIICLSVCNFFADILHNLSMGNIRTRALQRQWIKYMVNTYLILTLNW